MTVCECVWLVASIVFDHAMAVSLFVFRGFDAAEEHLHGQLYGWPSEIA